MRTPIVPLVSLSVLVLATGCDARGAEDGPALAEPLEATASASPAFADLDVQRIHDRMMMAMDPQGAYVENRYLAFTWFVQRAGGEPVGRHHQWDRWEGDVRVEGPTDNGVLVALFNVQDPASGSAWIDGAPVPESDKAELLERAHGMHINDSYWLVMPFKWADPGVTTRYLGEETDESGTSWEVVELSFESVGRTPQNVYHAYINPTSGLMERWAHFRAEGADPFFSTWAEWTDFGAVRLPLDRRWADGGRIYFEGVELSSEIPTGALAPPSA